ncbi:MAG: hypothetical protein CMH27_07875 [Micavibrio sp.]|nr:hypothetical protein [Micavibrio sp.]|tara:strand:- start:2298 stop:2843 length:546 start_codon:yes stop_codon:yes gene_type:complete
MPNVTKDSKNKMFTVSSDDTTTRMSFKDVNNYKESRGFIGAGAFMALFGPVVITGMFNSSSGGHPIPDALNNKQATAICLQENYNKKSPGSDNMVNLSAPEIQACADKKVAQARVKRRADIKNYYENKDNFQKIFTMVSSVPGLGMLVFGLGANICLRMEKPGIKHAAKQLNESDRPYEMY